ncbi:MAG: hypothetical protein CMM07_29405 [Rhodopirellula sp.]|nr:hypothetical protein [Rhodopirellula sp.]
MEEVGVSIADFVEAVRIPTNAVAGIWHRNWCHPIRRMFAWFCANESPVIRPHEAVQNRGSDFGRPKSDSISKTSEITAVQVALAESAQRVPQNS